MFIVGFPRSGCTWLSHMVAYLINARFDEYERVYSQDIETLQLKEWPKRKNLKHESLQHILGKAIKTHVYSVALKTTRVDYIVYLVRNGMDVLWAFYRRMIGDNRIDPKATPFVAFVRHRSREWNRHVCEWLRDDRVQVVIHYEHLLDNLWRTINNLRVDIESFAMAINPGDKDVVIPERVVDEIAEKYTFKAITGRRAGQEKHGSYFRKGIAGEGVAAFAKDDAATEVFWHCCREGMEKLGYKTP